MYFTALVEAVCRAVDNGCTSPTAVMEWLIAEGNQLRTSELLLALDAAVQDGRITWPRSPDGNRIDGGIRSAVSA